MRYGSVCAGIGGFDLGLDRAGMSCAWQIERDDFCRRVLEKHWPEVPRHPRMDLYSRRAIEALGLEPVDLICGGIPCQPWSVAGARRTTSDERDLWPAFRRMLGVLRPRYVIVEEVPGFALWGGLGRTLRDLADLGYDAEWDHLYASQFGAPHLRRRLWIVAYGDSNGNRKTAMPIHGKTPSSQGHAPDAIRHNGVELQTEGGLPGVIAQPKFARSERVDPAADRPRLEKRERQQGNDGAELAAFVRGGDWWAGRSPEPVLRGVDDGVPHRMDRIKSLGNALVPQIAEWLGRRIMVMEGE